MCIVNAFHRIRRMSLFRPDRKQICRRCAEHRVELGVVAAGVRNSASRGIGLRVGWSEDSVKLADYGDCRAISVPDFGPQAGDGESLPDGVA